MGKTREKRESSIISLTINVKYVCVCVCVCVVGGGGGGGNGSGPRAGPMCLCVYHSMFPYQ